MAEQATESKLIEASPERCYEVVLDFERYPEWVVDLKQVEVLDRDDQGRATEVLFRAAAFGRSVTYTLQYDYSDAPRRLSWTQKSGDLTRRIDGSYDFDAEGDGTRVTYHLEVELKLPIPGFIKSRSERLIIGSALRELKARAES